MREKYRILNQLQTDMQEYQREEITLEEKQQMLGFAHLLAKKQKKKRLMKVAAILICVGVTFLGLLNQESIQAMIDERFPQLAQMLKISDDYTQSVQVVSQEKGITVTVEEVLRDGEELYILYTVDLGEQEINPTTDTIEIANQNKIFNGREQLWLASQMGDFDEQNIYHGQEIINSFDLKGEDINFKWQIREIQLHKFIKGKEHVKKYKGNWEFTIKLNDKKLLAKTKEIKMDTTMELPDKVKVQFIKMRYNIIGVKLYCTIYDPNGYLNDRYLLIKGQDQEGKKVVFGVSNFWQVKDGIWEGYYQEEEGYRMSGENGRLKLQIFIAEIPKNTKTEKQEEGTPYGESFVVEYE